MVRDRARSQLGLQSALQGRPALIFRAFFRPSPIFALVLFNLSLFCS
jgi:hypothetical protein